MPAAAVRMLLGSLALLWCLPSTAEPQRLRHRQLFRVPVDFFCYPLGHYDARAVAAVRAAGFQGATTENEGLARPSEPFTLARIRIEPGDGVRGLIEKLHRYGAAKTI